MPLTDSWKKDNNMPIFKKNENPENSRLISLTPQPHKHIEDKKANRNSQGGFTKGKSRLVSLAALYSEMVGSVGMGRVVHIIQVNFHNAFDIISSIRPEQEAK